MFEEWISPTIFYLYGEVQYTHGGNKKRRFYFKIAHRNLSRESARVTCHRHSPPRPSARPLADNFTALRESGKSGLVGGRSGVHCTHCTVLQWGFRNVLALAWQVWNIACWETHEVMKNEIRSSDILCTLYRLITISLSIFWIRISTFICPVGDRCRVSVFSSA